MEKTWEISTNQSGKLGKNTGKILEHPTTNGENMGKDLQIQQLKWEKGKVQ